MDLEHRLTRVHNFIITFVHKHKYSLHTPIRTAFHICACVRLPLCDTECRSQILKSIFKIPRKFKRMIKHRAHQIIIIVQKWDFDDKTHLNFRFGSSHVAF